MKGRARRDGLKFFKDVIGLPVKIPLVYFDDLNGVILSVPSSMSSVLGESHDDIDSVDNNGQAMGVASQSRTKTSGNNERRFIRGVQIMLREKSTG